MMALSCWSCPLDAEDRDQADHLRVAESVGRYKVRESDMYHPRGPWLLEEDFTHDLRRWSIDINEKAGSATSREVADPERCVLVNDGGPGGLPALRLTLPGKPGDFRSEISLTWEQGYQERWYAQRTRLTQAPDEAGYIFTQWHALLGEENKAEKALSGMRAGPNVALHASERGYELVRNFGPLSRIQRGRERISSDLQVGSWISWVVHLVWSESSEGLIQVWLNGTLVAEHRGMNLYTEVLPVTPYYKTGIYRPLRKPKKGMSTGEAPITIYLRDLRIAGAGAALAQFEGYLSKP